MSFSSQVKSELYEHISSSRHCRLAELGALVTLQSGDGDKGKPNDKENKKKADKLARLLNIDINSEEATKALKLISMDDCICVDRMLVERSCCKQAFMRGAFLACGSLTDPNKGYHLELVCENGHSAELIMYIMGEFQLFPKRVIRKKYEVVYLKDGGAIVDFLNIIGAHHALMDMENVRILKDMRNSVNRRVNCETANINKTVSAAVKQIEDIRYIEEKKGLKFLPEGLRKVAELRVDEPEMSLREIGEMLNPPVGKSGVNHRLRKISEIANELRRK
ncbi:MAG: DNA-binding protein WhiA [Clostridium sp.]|nr:DNA-binding protein WhiA [Clostridium sp.]MCM1208135.1 DNA-binding protein WhiA [Ruminococcus sp.]